MSVVTDIAGAVGAEQAEDKQFAASQAALLEQQRARAAAIGQYQPYADFGAGGMGILSQLYGLNGQPADMSAFQASPGYQFRMQQGQGAIEGGAAARGGLYSGATAKALNDYSQNTASQEFDNYVNRLFGMTNIGQNAASGIANAELGQASNIGNIYGQIGQNQADAIKSQYNAWGSLGDQAAAAAIGGFTGGAAAGGGAAGTVGEGAAAGGGGFDLGKAAMMFFGA